MIYKKVFARFWKVRLLVHNSVWLVPIVTGASSYSPIFGATPNLDFPFQDKILGCAYVLMRWYGSPGHSSKQRYPGTRDGADSQ